MRSRLLLVVGLCWLLSGPLRAGTMLFDFETEAEAKAWHDERGTANRNFPVSLAERFAISGSHALCLRTPQWKEGMGQWPAFETAPALADWSGYDRLVFALTNATTYDQKLMLFVSDSKVPTRGGLQHRAAMLPCSFQMVVIPLAQLAQRKVNPQDIHVMHFFTERPVGDMEVYLDAIMLLKPGEALPPVPGSYLKDFAALQGGRVPLLRQAVAEARAGVRERLAGAPGVAPWAEAQLADCERQVDDLANLVAHAEEAILKMDELSRRLESDLAAVKARVDLRLAFEPVRAKVQADPSAPDDLVVGFATSMEKVLPNSAPATSRLDSTVSLALARNEKEALQVVVLPCQQAARQVQVRVRELRTGGGDSFASEHVQAVPVGYVETKAVPPYGSSHVGWWPDPILDFLSAADIEPGIAQAFWVRFRAPKDQAPGLYRGKLEVLVAGRPAYAFDLRVRVYPFTMPDRSPLNLAVTFSPHDHPTDESKTQQEAWRKSPEYPLNAWKQQRLAWGDFLADYYLTYDSLYHRGSPDFEILQRLQQRGQLGMFNLGYYDPMGETPTEQEAWRKNTLARIKAAYDQAKASGLLGHAYIYGCDENPKEKFPGVQRAAEVFKRECPGALVMTTTYDDSYGTDSVIKAMDAFCPLTPRYNRERADEVRAQGKQVWWYICCGPHHPYCNMFVEYPAIEGRLLMGAQTAKYRPDGFLYYQISIWNSQKPITSGPFTDWDPRSWTTYHGDGSWTCVGPGGTPLPTIRLENFRDGLEDYAYARLLEQAIRQAEASGQGGAWLERARRALEVPAQVMKSPAEYTHDPADVYRWRRAMAEAMATAPVALEGIE